MIKTNAAIIIREMLKRDPELFDCAAIKLVGKLLKIKRLSEYFQNLICTILVVYWVAKIS